VEERAEAGRPEEKSIDNCLKDAAIVGQVFFNVYTAPERK
jgi:hypothetical protein